MSSVPNGLRIPSTYLHTYTYLYTYLQQVLRYLARISRPPDLMIS